MITKRSKLKKAISLFLILSLLNINFSCYYYTYKVDSKPSAEKLNQLKNSPNYLIIHRADQTFNLKNVRVDEQQQSMSGVLQALSLDHFKYLATNPTPGRATRYQKHSPLPNVATPFVVNEVHLYLQDGPTLQINEEITIPLATIEKIDVYDPDTGATTASFILGGVAIAAGIIALITIIILLTKSSCPFVYVVSGHEFVFAGEIYSGAIFKGLERDDYLSLPRIESDSLVVKISNKLKEKQFINQLEIVQVTHPQGTEVLPDRLGNVHLIRNKVSVQKATVGGEDVTASLQRHDSLSFTFNNESRRDYFNEVILTFPKPDRAREGHLVLNAKNSLWGDYIFGEFTKLFGSSYSSWIEAQNKKPAAEMGTWAVDQGLAMKVFVQSGNEWRFVDVVDLVGPLAFRDLVIPVNLSGVLSDSVKIKLSAGFMLWDMDYAAMDYSADKQMEINFLNAASAIANGGTDALRAITTKDSNYFIQKNTGDEVVVTFSAKPAQGEGSRRDFILHSRGYYNHVRDYAGQKQVTALLAFKSEGRFSKFSKEQLEEMTGLMSVAEISASTKRP